MRTHPSSPAAYRLPRLPIWRWIGEIWRALRWVIYAVTLILERPVIIGLTAAGWVVLAMCALIHYTVVNSHFPMGTMLTLGLSCLASTVLYFALQALVKPEPR